VDYVRQRFGASQRHACVVFGIARRVYAYRSCREAHTAVRSQIEEWRIEYNESRPHRALKEIPPAEFARCYEHLAAAQQGKKPGD